MSEFLDLPEPLSRLVAGSLMVVAAAVLSDRCAGVIVRLLIRRAANRRLLTGRGSWKTRTKRSTEFDASLAEERRRRRIDATATAVSRIVTVVIWSTVVVLLLHRHGISISVAVGSAGFVGLVLALGGQGSVNDYVTGLHVLLEDRFGEGDEIEITTLSGRTLRGVVTGQTMFSSRIVSDGATHHITHRHMNEVTNHSQLGCQRSFVVPGGTDEDVLRAAFGDAVASRPHFPVTVVEAVSPHQEGSEIVVRSARELGPTEEHHLIDELRALIDERTPPDRV